MNSLLFGSFVKLALCRTIHIFRSGQSVRGLVLSGCWGCFEPEFSVFTALYDGSKACVFQRTLKWRQTNESKEPSPFSE